MKPPETVLDAIAAPGSVLGRGDPRRHLRKRRGWTSRLRSRGWLGRQLHESGHFEWYNFGTEEEPVWAPFTGTSIFRIN